MSLTDTIHQCGYVTDERGLVELSLARRRVAEATEFRRGAGQTIAGSWVWDSERLWACLLSLADAEEFVREACRIEWHFHPRAQQTLEPIERYGEGILPWLTSRVVERVLYNLPCCVLPLLNQIGGEEAFQLLLSVDTLAMDDARFPGPFAPDGPGDVERSELSFRAESASEALLAFAWENPEASFPSLYEQAVEHKNERARAVLRAAAASEPTLVFQYIAADWEEEEAKHDLDALGIPYSLTEQVILRALDAACEQEDAWPIFASLHPDRAYQALRLVVFRESDGDGWVVLFECLEGSSPDALCLKRYVQTSAAQVLLSRSGSAELFACGDWDDAGENVVVGPEGEITLTLADLQKFEPLRSTARDAVDMRFCLFVRAYLEVNPDAFWSDEDCLRSALEAEGADLDGYELLLESTAFEHVVGQASDAFASGDIDLRWRRLPSETAVYRSLAAAIVSRDAALFQPGEANLSWRLHLDASDAGRFLR